MSKHLDYFNLEETATEEQLQDIYSQKVQELERAEIAEVERAETLKEIELEFEEAKKEIKFFQVENKDKDPFYEVRKEIKEHNCSEAQNILDNIDERNAEWHYHQAMIYYEQGWTTEAKRKLEYAISLDGQNEKYKKAYDNLMAKEIFSRPFEEEQGRKTKTTRTYSPETDYERERRKNAGCCACQSLLCADCCCECFGGDLIPCC